MQKVAVQETVKRDVKYEERPIVILKATYLKSTEAATPKFKRVFDGYYSYVLNGFIKYAEGTLFKKAKNNCEREDFLPFGAVLQCTVSYEDELLLSVVTDIRISDGYSIGNTVRCAQVWHKKQGFILKYRDFFDKQEQNDIINSITEYVNNSDIQRYSDYERLIKQRFDKENFYIVPEGFTFFYPSGMINSEKNPFTFLYSKNIVYKFSD